MPAPYVRLGRIARSHGTTGEVGLAVRDDLPLHELVGVVAWIVPPPPAGARPTRIEAVRRGPKGPIVTLRGVETREDARDLSGRWLLASADDVPETAAHVDDLAGYAVVDEERGHLGVVTGTIVTGANDVLIVTGGSFGQVLVPVIDDVVRSVQPDERRVTVRLLPGLIEEEGA